MNDFRLPVSKTSLPDPEPLSMDDYAKMVLANLHAMRGMNPDFESRRKESVNVPFSLEPDIKKAG